MDLERNQKAREVFNKKYPPQPTLRELAEKIQLSESDISAFRVGSRNFGPKRIEIIEEFLGIKKP